MKDEYFGDLVCFFVFITATHFIKIVRRVEPQKVDSAKGVGA